ncbi:Mitogen-activated protein kinase kinase 1 [Diplonema papillatum]|nr:Mitogen-activated protein kinase kinase 1 [Diplonema papillatum]
MQGGGWVEVVGGGAEVGSLLGCGATMHRKLPKKPPKLEMPVPEVDDRDKAVQKEKQLAETVAAAVVEGNETKLGLDTAAGDPHMRTQPSKRKVRKGIKYQDLKFLPYVIGRGSFGEVKMVQHEKDGSLYALKEIKVGDAEAAKKTIKSELERLQAVFSRYTVRTYEAYIGTASGTARFLLEYMDYGSVGTCYTHLTRMGRKLSVCDVHLIAKPVLSALDEFRKQHIVHKDIKPANILINYKGQVKVGDFGISCFTNQNSIAESITGSLVWMAPERIRSQSYSYNSDVYSLGLVVRYLDTGLAPDRVEQAVCLPDLDLSTILNQAMRDFVLQATRSDPAVRPQASDLIRHPFIEDAPDGAGNGLSFLHLLPAYAEASKRLQQRRKQQHEQRERQLRERKAAAGNVKPHRDQAHKDPAAHSPPEPLAMPVFTVQV